LSGTAAYDQLCAHLRELAALEQVAGLLTWDQETQMPKRGAAQRAEASGAVAAAAHRLRVDPRIPEWAAAAEGCAPGRAGRVNVAEALRLHRRALRVPASLAADLGRAAAQGQVAWDAARRRSDFAKFVPALSRIVELKRAEADCLTDAGGDPYDALLEEYEPGIASRDVANLFDQLRPGLRDLRARIAAVAGPDRPGQARGRFPAEAQIALSRRLADVFGFDWSAGRLDLAVHPSASGTRGDVRITTRVNPDDPFESLYSTIHELGHGRYEQSLPEIQVLMPAGTAASMGVHESQSRLFENQFGRSRAFCDWLHGALRDAFGDTGLDSPDALYRAVNAVRTGFIRTEADEVHYNLHVMMRFDLERALIRKELEVAELESAWNDRFWQDFGREVPDAGRGVLQDVHWAVGLFGYFPTYTLGNLYAAELHRALCADLPDLGERLAAGDLGPVLDWLGDRVHRQGRLWPPAELIARACGRPADPATLLDYLETKYAGLYDV
jgi:carboxypeptidase Taq